MGNTMIVEESGYSMHKKCEGCVFVGPKRKFDICFHCANDNRCEGCTIQKYNITFCNEKCSVDFFDGTPKCEVKGGGCVLTQSRPCHQCNKKVCSGCTERSRLFLTNIFCSVECVKLCDVRFTCKGCGNFGRGNCATCGDCCCDKCLQSCNHCYPRSCKSCMDKHKTVMCKVCVSFGIPSVNLHCACLLHKSKCFCSSHTGNDPCSIAAFLPLLAYPTITKDLVCKVCKTNTKSITACMAHLPQNLYRPSDLQDYKKKFHSFCSLCKDWVCTECGPFAFTVIKNKKLGTRLKVCRDCSDINSSISDIYTNDVGFLISGYTFNTNTGKIDSIS